MPSGAIIWRFVLEGPRVAHDVAFLLVQPGLAYFQFIIIPILTDCKNLIFEYSTVNPET
jgi:hypothetical protein